MKRIIISLGIIMPIYLTAQVTINNCEDFPIGTVLKFLNCNATGVTPGTSGASQNWNYGSLVPIGDTITEWMISPASTGLASMFPTANLVEKYSTGAYVFANKTSGNNFLLGYVDSTKNLNIQYPNSVLFAVRPISYGNTIIDTFTEAYKYTGYDFRGLGVCTIKADGYGTLVLPNLTANNVLRLTITQITSDTLIQFGTVTQSISKSYIWFDGVHSSALLKIDSNAGGTSVQYLGAQFMTGVNEVIVPTNFNLYPNPAKSTITVESEEQGVLNIMNIIGETVMRYDLENGNHTIPIEGLKSGLYFVELKTSHDSKCMKLLLD